MKNIILVAAVVLAMTSCRLPWENDSTVFNTEELEGKYKVSLGDIIKDAIEVKDNDDHGEVIGKAIAGVMLSSIDMTVSFYPDNKGIFSYSAFGNTGVNPFEYKLESDSLLFIKYEDNGYKEIGTLRKFSDTYDYIQIITKKDSTKSLTLIKISE